MAKDHRFYICMHCKNIIGMIKSSGVPIYCCGEPMAELIANTSDGAVEKHLSVGSVSGNTVKVTIGSVAHPMVEEHFIEWVYLQTGCGGQRKCLSPGDKPEVSFALVEGEKPVAVFEYCNLHGLWKTEL